MSSQEHPCSGYVIEVSALRSLLPENLLPAFDLLDNDDDVFEFLNDNLPNELPHPSSVFTLSQEDSSDDLEIGVQYAYFDESDLYELVPSPAHLALAYKINKLITARASWSTFS